jgi:hypothetical protein
MSSKYRALTDHLTSLETDEVRLSFARIEQILGFTLPPSASAYQAWWSNNPRSQSLSWLAAGFRTINLDLAGEMITFIRVEQPIAGFPDDDPGEAAPEPLTIALAKRGLAATYGVDPSQVDITIRG